MEKRIREFCVMVNENGMRLDEFLALKIARLSRSRAQSCIRGGAVSIMPFRVAKPSLKVKEGDVVTISQTLVGDIAMYDDLHVIDETSDFWVFDKPAGMAVHPTGRIYHNTVTRYVESVLKSRAFVVHRLDKETSGVLLMAKTPEAGNRLGELFRAHDVEKIYEAVCLNGGGALYPGRAYEVDIPLGFAGIELPKITMGVGDLEARTRVTCESIQGAFAWVKAQLLTGRQHQIRVHLSLTGTPILGDKLYLYGESFYRRYLDGEETVQFAPPRQLLHASSLSLSWQGKTFVWSSPVPEMMHQVYRAPLTEAMTPTDYSKLFLR